MQGTPSTTTRSSSRADDVTGTPGRHTKQLVAHLKRKIGFRADGPVSSATIGDGAAQLVVGYGVLATGDDERSVTLIEPVPGSHLERFGQRADLTVSWARTTAPDPARPGASPVRRPAPHLSEEDR